LVAKELVEAWGRLRNAGRGSERASGGGVGSDGVEVG
jgi:hypothetical protein